MTGLVTDATLIGMSGLAAFVSIICVYRALLVRDPMAGRLRAVTRRRSVLQADATASDGHHTRRHVSSGSLMQRTVDRLNLATRARRDVMKLKLAQAGYRDQDAVVRYFFARLTLPLVFAGLGLFMLYGLESFELPNVMKMAICGGLAVLGLQAPDIYLKNTKLKRQDAMTKGLPDGLDLLVICTEAGLSLDSALDRVSRETGNACPELAEELALASVELGFLPDRRKALANLAERTDLPAIRGVVNSLAQTEKYGTPLSQSLRVLSKEFRNERMMKAEEKAARLPAVMTVPLILFILPPLFIILLGPAALRTIDSLSGI